MPRLTMPRLTHVAAAVLATVGQAACADPGRTTAPQATAAARTTAGAAAATGATGHQVNMMDACEPTTFNAALRDPTACLRNGGVTFQDFIAQLQQHQSIGAWHFAPPMMNVAVGSTITAVNRGGEVHTFTEVEEFGGGIVPILNTLTGNPVVAPECQALEGDDFVPPGGTYKVTEDEPGVEHYQCCIHPWMRTTVRVRGT